MRRFLTQVFGVIPKKMVLLTNNAKKSKKVCLRRISSGIDMFTFYVPSNKKIKAIDYNMFSDTVDDYLVTIWKKLSKTGRTCHIFVLIDEDAEKFIKKYLTIKKKRERLVKK